MSFFKARLVVVVLLILPCVVGLAQTDVWDTARAICRLAGGGEWCDVPIPDVAGGSPQMGVFGQQGYNSTGPVAQPPPPQQQSQPQVLVGDVVSYNGAPFRDQIAFAFSGPSTVRYTRAGAPGRVQDLQFRVYPINPGGLQTVQFFDLYGTLVMGLQLQFVGPFQGQFALEGHQFIVQGTFYLIGR